jgi:hypothetical protein
MLFACGIATFIGLVQAARKRRPHVSFLDAIASRSVMFRPDLYEDNARRWAKVHVWGFVGVFVSLGICGISMLFLKALE